MHGTAANVRVLYAILTNPFMHGAPRNQGVLDESSMLRMHLLALAELQPLLVRRVMIMVPGGGPRRVSGYLDVEKHIERLPFPATIEHMRNNSMGSYGMFLEAFARTRSRDARHDYYIFSEDDYIPVRADFDVALVRMHDMTFGAHGFGLLTGVLQGRPVEPSSEFNLHPESSAMMSGHTLNHLFRHTFDVHRWNESMIERSFTLLRREGPGAGAQYFDKIQLAFGVHLTPMSMAFA